MKKREGEGWKRNKKMRGGRGRRGEGEGEEGREMEKTGGVEGVNSLPSKLGRKVESGLKARSGRVTARKTRYRLHTL